MRRSRGEQRYELAPLVRVPKRLIDSVNIPSKEVDRSIIKLIPALAVTIQGAPKHTDPEPAVAVHAWLHAKRQFVALLDKLQARSLRLERDG